MSLYGGHIIECNLISTKMQAFQKVLENFEFIWRSHYRVQSYLHQDASISKSEMHQQWSLQFLSFLWYQEYKNLLQATSYLWLALQGPALSLARLRYICSLEPVHVAIVLIFIIIFMLPMQYASLSKSLLQHTWSNHKTTHTWRGTGLGGGEWVYLLLVCCMTIGVVVCAWQAKSPQAFWIPLFIVSRIWVRQHL